MSDRVKNVDTSHSLPRQATFQQVVELFYDCNTTLATATVADSY